jgi:hypothetical protein
MSRQGTETRVVGEKRKPVDVTYLRVTSTGPFRSIVGGRSQAVQLDVLHQ